ncbi:hypothetical protein B0H17DRAFT_1324529 [Mycena rosella]|uniref:Uncharacterized protein n=1 Tax=Mycena rosella TaxID=1033263 RepID=A0AAD7MBR6_MYCRO|nr:hypothetical protein B0H17DRAFT_1324529 [Mycena rosella]
MVKRRKISGLNSLELFQAYTALKGLRDSFDYTEEEGADTDSEEGPSNLKLELFSEQIAKIINMMEVKLEEPEVLTAAVLEERLNVVHEADLQLGQNYMQRIQTSRALEGSHYMTSELMHRHLAMLKNLVPRTSEAAARLWIDTIFFSCRVHAIHPSSDTFLTGKVDYTAVVASKDMAEWIHKTPAIDTLKRRTAIGFFVTEGKLDSLYAHLPQACADLYAAAKKIRKPILRGALTNGNEWFFIILKVNPDGHGGSYKYSLPLSIVPLHPTKQPSGPDLIAGILADWASHSIKTPPIISHYYNRFSKDLKILVQTIGFILWCGIDIC